MELKNLTLIKKIFIGFFLLNSLTLFSQNIEIVGGLNKNLFFNFRQRKGHYNSSYKSDYGNTFRVGIENIKIYDVNMRFTLGYDNYSGKIRVSDGGLSGGYSTNTTVEKSIISFGVFPINFKILNKIDLNFGFEFAGLIYKNLTGKSSMWSIGKPDRNYDLNKNYSAKTYFGLRGRIAYDFNISDKLIISPQYSYYFGLSNEFDKFPKTTKSMRHYFCIGFQKSLK